MSNQLYAYPRERMLGAFNWQWLDLVLIAWSGVYVFDEAHVFSRDVLAQGAVAEATSLPVTNVVAAPGGYARTDPVVLPAVPVVQILFLTLCEAGADGDSHLLIEFIDDGVGIPFTGIGLDEVIQPDWLTKRGWFRP